MLNLILTGYIKIKPLVVSTAFFLAIQTSVNAEPPLRSLTTTQAQNLSRDLVPYNSQIFFRQGKKLIEREIKILRLRQLHSIEPVLKIDLVQQLKRPHTQQKPNILTK
jgi:hypothetical protein